MKLILKKGGTNVSVYLFIQDSSSTTGAGLTGLVYNSASLVCYYVRPLSAAAALTLATQTVTGAHSDGGFVEVDATNMPGVYRLDLSDAILATGVDSVAVMLKGATNMAPLTLEIQLANVDNDNLHVITTQPNIPEVIDLANTALWRVGLQVLDSQGNLPSTAEITPGTYDIDRKAAGGTTWSSIVSGGTCLEVAGIIYFNEVFDTGAGYAEGDIVRFVLIGQSVAIDGVTYELTNGAFGSYYYSHIRYSEIAADVVKVSGSTVAADNLEEGAKAIITGTAVTGTLSTTQATTDLTGYADDELIGRTLTFSGGTADGQGTDITDYASASGLITFDAITTAPVNLDPFVIA